MKRFCISSYWLCLYPNEISIDSELIQTGVKGPCICINVFHLLKVHNNASYIIKYKRCGILIWMNVYTDAYGLLASMYFSYT